MTQDELNELVKLPAGIEIDSGINYLTLRLGRCTLSMKQWNTRCNLNCPDIPYPTRDIEILGEIAKVLKPLHSKIFNL